MGEANNALNFFRRVVIGSGNDSGKAKSLSGYVLVDV